MNYQLILSALCFLLFTFINPTEKQHKKIMWLEVYMAAKEMKLSTYIKNFQILILYTWDSLSTINIYFFFN